MLVNVSTVMTGVYMGRRLARGQPCAKACNGGGANREFKHRRLIPVTKLIMSEIGPRTDMPWSAGAVWF